jgi:5,10-methylenetetrahydromethanopterin reductase
VSGGTDERSSARHADVRFGFVTPAFEGAEWARHCEESGADLITCGEGPTVFTDPTISLALYAAATSRIRLGTSVTAPGLRHPAVLANTFSTLQQLSQGRIVLGIGTGDLSLIQIGEQPSRLQPFLDYSLVVRALCSGEQAEYDGKQIALQWTAGPVPLWFGADAPRALELAGRHADGVIVGQAFHPDIVRHVRRHVGAGAEAAGRDFDDIEIWYLLRAVVTDEPHGAIAIDGLDDYAARQTHFLLRMADTTDANTITESLVRRKGFQIDDDLAQRLARYAAAYDESKAFGTKHNVELLDRLGLRDWAGRLFYKSGPVKTIADEVTELVEAGASCFLVPLMLGDKLAGVDDTVEVFARLRSMRGE